MIRTSHFRERRERYGLLFCAIVTAFAIQGIATPGPWEQVAVTALLGATLVLALWAAEARPIVVRSALVLVVAVVAFSAVEAASGKVDVAATRLANVFLLVLAPPAIVVGIVRSLRARRGVTIAAVFGVLCLYILLGMFFAGLYSSLDRLNPHFFANDAQASVSNCLYFSFTTLTTVGYGDFTAAGQLGHTLAVSEALLGQIYLVTIVSLIVGNLGQRRLRDESSSAA
jgi:Ion channel